MVGQLFFTDFSISFCYWVIIWFYFHHYFLGGGKAGIPPGGKELRFLENEFLLSQALQQSLFRNFQTSFLFEVTNLVKDMLNCCNSTAAPIQTPLKNFTPIRILATNDHPYATECLDVYPHDNECTHPGLEIEYIYTIISEMMGRAVQWIKVDSYDTMDEYLNEGKGDILGISYILDLGKPYPPARHIDYVFLL